MDLSDYLKETCQSAAEFGRGIGVSRATVSRWLDGTRRPCLPLVRTIENATRGQVTRSDLRPDIFGEAA